MKIPSITGYFFVGIIIQLGICLENYLKINDFKPFLRGIIKNKDKNETIPNYKRMKIKNKNKIKLKKKYNKIK